VSFEKEITQGGGKGLFEKSSSILELKRRKGRGTKWGIFEHCGWRPW